MALILSMASIVFSLLPNAVSRKKDQRQNFKLLSQLFPDFSVKVLDPEGQILYFDGDARVQTRYKNGVLVEEVFFLGDEEKSRRTFDE